MQFDVLGGAKLLEANEDGAYAVNREPELQLSLFLSALLLH